MNKIEGCLLLLGIALLSIWSGRKAKDQYFKGQYFVLGIMLIICAIVILVKPASTNNSEQSSRKFIEQKKVNASKVNEDSLIKRTKKNSVYTP